MCPPILAAAGALTAGQLAAAQLAVGVGSALAGYAGQQQAANAQAKYNDQAAKAAVDAANQTYQATHTRMGQEVAAASNEKFGASVAAAEARATATTAAGEAGVQGNSISQLMQSYYTKQGRYNASLDTNLQMSRQGLINTMDQTHNGAVSSINSLPMVQKPSFLDAAIRVAGAGLSATTDYYKMTH